MAYMTIQEAEEAIANFERALPSIKQVISAAKMLDALRAAPTAPPAKVIPRPSYKVAAPVIQASAQGLSGFVLQAVGSNPGIKNNSLRDLVAASPHANPDAKRQVPAALHYLKNRHKLIEGSDSEGFRLTHKGRDELRGGAR